MKTKTENILRLLGTGKEHARKADDLAGVLNCTKRELCSMIETARREGVLICSGNPGYWRPGSQEELEQTYKIMRRRSLSMLFTMKTTRKALLKWKNPEEVAQNEH